MKNTNLELNTLKTATLHCYIPKDKSINKIIIGRPKCGSRFLNDCGGFDIEPLDVDTFEQIKNADIVYWLIREPLEHFGSALITELNGKYVSTPNPYITSKKIKIKNNDEKFLYDLLESLLQEIATEPIFQKKENYLFSHYWPIYEELFQVMKSEYSIFYNVKFIELNELSDIVNHIFNITHKYTPDTYSFNFNIENNPFTTKNIFNILRSERYIIYWDKIKNIVKNDANAYSIISNFNFSKFLIKIIHELYIKLDIMTIENNKNYVDMINKLNKILNNKNELN
jgi:hypothetical protein